MPYNWEPLDFVIILVGFGVFLVFLSAARLLWIWGSTL